MLKYQILNHFFKWFRIEILNFYFLKLKYFYVYYLLLIKKISVLNTFCLWLHYLKTQTLTSQFCSLHDFMIWNVSYEIIVWKFITYRYLYINKFIDFLYAYKNYQIIRQSKFSVMLKKNKQKNPIILSTVNSLKEILNRIKTVNKYNSKFLSCCSNTNDFSFIKVIVNFVLNLN